MLHDLLQPPVGMTAVELADGRRVRCLRASEAELPAPSVEALVQQDSDTGEISALRVEGLVASYGSTEVLHSVDLRLVACGHIHQRRDFTYGHIRHVWAPSAGFILPDSKQEVIGIKEVGLVEYRFQPDAFEVLHVRAPGQIDLDGVSLLVGASKSY